MTYQPFYRVYFTNFGIELETKFQTFEAAMVAAEKRGFEATIIRQVGSDQAPVASWCPIGGTRKVA